MKFSYSSNQLKIWLIKNERKVISLRKFEKNKKF